MTVNERIDVLRQEMKKEKVDIYLIPMADYHISEYVGDHFKGVEFISGFTGTNATVVITQTEAGLWTDGRYFIQAEKELKGSYVKLFPMEQEGVPTVNEFIREKLKEHGVLGFDGRCYSYRDAKELESIAKEKEGTLFINEDLLNRFWNDRPEQTCRPVWILKNEYAGKTVAEKLQWLRETMKEEKADGHILTSLYDIAWLLNLRGDDIASVPVFMAYFYLTEEKATVYADKRAFSEEVMQYLTDNRIQLHPYEAIYEELPASKEKRILCDPDILNVRLFNALPKDCEAVFQPNPTEYKKSVKNDVEINNTKLAHIKDGVAVTKFLYWLKMHIGKEELTEISVASYLLNCRKKQKHFLDVSFDTIAAYGPNAAMMHYTANEEHNAVLKPEGFLLVDSGGHYLEGTTDITRTIVLGALTEKMKTYFTTALRSNLRLAAAKFPQGCIGQNLDILARGPVWDLGLDYRCGTGHGVGHILNVHEGPNAFRWKVKDKSKVWELKPGMITTDEPGLYIEDEFGIRHENELLCEMAEKTEYGQFYQFEPLTMVPFDLEAVKPEMLTYLERETLNAYHKKVYETIAPYLDADEAAWLKKATRAI